MQRIKTSSVAIAAFILSVGYQISTAQSATCTNLSSAAERRNCADKNFKAAEAEVDSAFNGALAQYEETPEALKSLERLPQSERVDQLVWEKRMVRRLKTSQANWLVYRQSACAAVAENFGKGSIGPDETELCKADLDRSRAKFLNQFFAIQK